MNRTATVALLVAGLAGCASSPKPLQGQFSNLLPEEASRLGTGADAVRWGGRIVKVAPQASRSCFEIVGLRLDSSGQPLRHDRSEGRFLACRAGFYDPEVFKAGREITVTGRIEGFETHAIGEYEYRYPRVQADVVYLWPERRDIDVIVERVPYW